MKRLLASVLLAVLFVGNAFAYEDIDSSDKDYEEIKFVEELKLFPGTNFDPNKLVTRGEFIKLLLVKEGLQAEDVDLNVNIEGIPHDIAPFELKMRELGIITKLGKTGFEADSPINVSAALDLAMKLDGVPVPKVFDKEAFHSEVSGVSSGAFYSPIIARALEADLIKPVNKQFSPFKRLTRRDFAVMVANLELLDSKFYDAVGDFPDVVVIDADLLHANQVVLTQEQYAILEETWSRILDDYIDKGSVDKNALFYGLMTGLVDSLDDPYSVFQEPKISEAFSDSLNNELEGIGASVSFDENDRLVIVAPLVGSPAEKAGLLPGDIITKINGQGVDNASLTELVNRIKGDAGTDVELSILRGNSNLKFTVTRSKINVPAVTYEVTSTDVAIVKITNFGTGVSADFRDFTQEVDMSQLNGIIIDLRNNPGGYINSAVDIADMFLTENKVIVKTQESDGKISSTSARAQAELQGMKTVVLLNGGSASASEILAAALKDNGVATIIGEKSFGKGSVQELVDFTDSSALKLTIARWLTPNGNQIDKVGIEPDIKVTTTDADRNAGNDPILNRALQEF